MLELACRCAAQRQLVQIQFVEADAEFIPAALMIGLAGAWFSASEAIRRFDAKDPWSPKRLAQFRTAVVDASTRILRS